MRIKLNRVVPSQGRRIKFLQAAFITLFLVLVAHQLLMVGQFRTLIGPTKNEEWSPSTLSGFPVAGVNLAQYEKEVTAAGSSRKQTTTAVPPYELFADFDIADQIKGNEGWWDLMAYRNKLQRPSLSFYIDKIAQKRWLPSIGIPTPKPFVLKYASELTSTGRLEDETQELIRLLPTETSYAAKPNHKSSSFGVTLVKYDKKGANGGTTSVGHGDGRIEKVEQFNSTDIANKLAKNLHEGPPEFESWALNQVKPGIVVEERFTAWDTDDVPALEFQIFTVWGRVWLGHWRRGGNRGKGRCGLVDREGVVLDWIGKNEEHSTIPDWVDWSRIVKIAEKLGVNKDMFRVDVYVGVPAGSPSLREGVTDKEKRAAVQIVVSECEIFSTTPLKEDHRLFEEAARLWIAGYKIGNFHVIPNTQVPSEYLEASKR